MFFGEYCRGVLSCSLVSIVEYCSSLVSIVEYVLW